MNQNISPKADIHKNAVLGSNVTVMPFAVIEENVKVGDNCFVGPGVHLTGWTDIGKNNKILSSTAIGNQPQDLSYKQDRSYVEIGDNNIFHEFVTIHRGTAPESKTVIGNNNMFMAGSHAAHNVVVKNNVVIVNCTALGGYVQIDDSCFISYASSFHQFTRLGRFVMVAPYSKIAKDIPPFMLISGPIIAQVRGLNVVGLRRNGVSSQDRELIKKAYKLLYHEGLNRVQAIERISSEQDLKDNPYIIELLNFIKDSKRGICGHYRGKESEEE